MIPSVWVIAGSGPPGWLAAGFGVKHSWYCGLVYSLSPHPGLRLSGIQRGQRFLRWPVRRWRSISRCWRRTPPEDAPTSPAGWWGCAATPGCSPALNCTLTEGEEELCLQVIYTKTSVEKPADAKLLWYITYVNLIKASWICSFPCFSESSLILGQSWD